MKSRRDPAREAEELAVAEEVLSLLRHDARNKLSAARQAGAYLKSRAERTDLWTADARVPRFFHIIDEQLLLADEILERYDGLARVHDRTPQALDPARVVSAAVAAARPLGEVKLTTSVAPGPLFADQHELVLALRHLVDNAVEATPLGKTVTVEGAPAEGAYAFVVRDEGPGLHPDDFARVVRPFVSTRVGRRGLGLSIARRVASRWGGSLGSLPSDSGAAIELRVGAGAP